MKVLVVSDYFDQGGAAIACNRLCEALMARTDVQLHRFTLSNAPVRSPFPLTQGVGRRAEGFFHLVDHKRTARFARRLRHRVTSRRLRQLRESMRPDVVNIHNLHGSDLPLELIGSAVSDTPAVWTLHDMWSFTGRCAYAYDCTQFQGGCSASCPTPTEYPALPPRLISVAWRKKTEWINRGIKTAAVCPSDWLARSARQGAWGSHTVKTIPNGLPLNVFFPVPKAAARQTLNLPVDGVIGLAAADYLKERRKGGHLIGRALQLGVDSKFTLMTMGNSKGFSIDGVAVHPLGYISDDAVKRLVYSAADFLIHPAPVDNLPNTVVEAMACGTPTAAFRTGGLPELVFPGSTGWLCDTLSSEAFAATLAEALRDIRAGKTMSTSSRRRAEQIHGLDTMAESYCELFSDCARA